MGFSIAIMIALKNAGYYKAVPASGYAISTIFNQSAIEKIKSRFDEKFSIKVWLQKS
jgi:hypothetical protein